MSAKIFRDPLYNYVSIERSKDGWLLDVLNSPELQRLRRIHQLGVSYLTFPGADHNRLAHSLGVLHLMSQVMTHLESNYQDAQVRRAREPLLAAALVHDVGHGPFSHLFEPCLGIDHEKWSIKIIESPDTTLYKALRACDQSLPRTVAELVDPENHEHPAWQKYLLSSQLDMDRLDYLRRDSLFTGADYGHFDWYRLINSLELHDDDETERDIIWPEKTMPGHRGVHLLAILHVSQRLPPQDDTRFREAPGGDVEPGETVIRAKARSPLLVPSIEAFWNTPDPSVDQYLAIEEFTVLQQIQNWTSHPDKALNDLARRFLHRDRLWMIEAPDFEGELDPDYAAWEEALRNMVGAKVEYDPVEMYCLVDRVKAKYNQPYFPEKEDDEQSVKNAIRIQQGESKPVEISTRRERLKPVTAAPVEKVRYYIPKEFQKDAERLRAQWK